MPEYPALEWIESQGRMADGLDLLGLRLPVQLISGSLLNGVTTISPRVRYLTIRSWIIKAFSESELLNDSSTFNLFAGRVEAALALSILLVNRNTIYIPGSDKGRTIIDESVDPIPIEQLLTQTAFKAYTGPSYDLFLNYYADNGVPGLTRERGEPLALAFETQISQTRFLEILKNDPEFSSLSRDVLMELGEAINIDDVSGIERELLLKAILPSEPHEKAVITLRKEINRLGVYTYLLELAKQVKRPPEETDVFDLALQPDPQVSELLLPILDGYLRYRIRDLLSVVHEAVLGEVCAELGGFGGSISSNQIVGNLLGEHVNTALRKFDLITEGELFVNVRYRDLFTRIEAMVGEMVSVRGINRWASRFDESAVIKTVLDNQAASVGLQPVAWMLCQLRVGDYDLGNYPDLEILSRQGQARLGLQQIILKQHQMWMEENPSLDQVIAWQIQRTVDQHLRIAWSRMFTDVNKDVAILASDGDTWMHRGKDYVGGRTASRISQAINWLRQLQLIDKAGLTAVGETVLQRGYDVLALRVGDI